MSVQIGDKFYRLEIKHLESRKSGRFAYVKCDCGNSKWVMVRYLVSGDSKSCGCLRKEIMGSLKRLSPYKNISQSYFNSFKRSAKKRNLEFDMTIEDVWNVWEKQNFICALTGLKLSFPKFRNDKSGTASIDRIDSLKGYTPDNIQIVHKEINRLKNNYSQGDFIYWCRLVVSNFHD